MISKRTTVHETIMSHKKRKDSYEKIPTETVGIYDPLATGLVLWTT